MKDLNGIRLSLLKELKNIRLFFDNMEKGVKSRDARKIKRAYYFIKTLVYHMDEGDLTPLSIELHEALYEDYINSLKEQEDGDT
jgi:hypothetical protein